MKNFVPCLIFKKLIKVVFFLYKNQMKCLEFFLAEILLYGYAAQWLTEWYSYNDRMIKEVGGNPEIEKSSIVNPSPSTKLSEVCIKRNPVIISPFN